MRTTVLEKGGFIAVDLSPLRFVLGNYRKSGDLMPRPRKVVELPPVAPGPDMLELRYGRRGEMAKCVFAQPVHSYTIDTTDPTRVVITGVVRLPDAPKPTPSGPEPEDKPETETA